MSKLAWICAAFGFWVAGVIVFAIAFDIRQVETDRITISHWCLMTAREHPWFVAVLVVPPTYVLGILTGHLLFPQYIPR